VRLGDLELLLLGVAGETEHLHAVAKRRRHRVEDVRGRDEEHLAEVERHLEVVVGEREVLLGVEHLEERGRRIAAEVGPDLVDLVEHDDRVLRPRPLDPLDDAAGERADVGPAMPRTSASSRMPPKEIRPNLRPIARAIDLPSEVLPTPGGPARQRIGPLRSFLRARTERNSRMRSLTFSRS
jgi:hypothetical protein